MGELYDRVVALLILSPIFVIAIAVIISRRIEMRIWNWGSCKICGAKMISFDMDSQGKVGYKCSAHGFDHPDLWIGWFNPEKRRLFEHIEEQDDE